MPVHKSGETDLVHIYWSISILLGFSEIYETPISRGLASFFSGHDLFAAVQFRFRGDRSTKSACASLIDTVYEKLFDMK